MSEPDLRTTYLGLELRSPLVASSSPLTNHLDTLRRLEAAGAGAVVLPSLFEEQLAHDELEVERMLATGAESFGEATSFFPEPVAYESTADRHLRLVEEATEALEVPVLASLNGTAPGTWARWATRLEAAGAAAIELNVYRVAADPTRSGADVEDETVELVAEVVAAVDVPVAVKLSPYWSALAHLATRLADAGAAGLVLFNRFYQPDLDLETLAPAPHLHLSTPDELLLPLRWVAILHGAVDAELALTSGVHAGEDAAKALLAGAQVAMLASALLRFGPSHLAGVTADLRAWMAERGYASVDQLRGSAARAASPDPEGFERANYVQTLVSWSSADEHRPSGR